MTDRARRYHEAVKAVERHGSKAAAAVALGLNREAVRDRIRRGPGEGEAEAPKAEAPEMESAILRDKIRTLTSQLASAQRDALTEEYVKREILRVSEIEPDPPEWLIRPKKGHVSGVPTLVLSDWHLAETISKSQVGGVNEYNSEIARRRVRTVIEVAIHLLRTQLAAPNYPGIVVCLGGDFLSGSIHDLDVSNDREIMQACEDLFSLLVWSLDQLADAFGNVFAVCVTGNHSRTTHKPRDKNRAFLSYEWLIYRMLSRHYTGDKRLRFLIPDGPDAYYRIYDHAFLLTHGDQFKSGDSAMIGPLGAILRGDHRKRTRNSQVGKPYRTMILGHWHQLIMLDRVIVNGSLSGYSEYASQLNLPYEAPRQACFITNEKYGITLAAPVNADRPHEFQPAPWVSWKDEVGR